MPHSKFSCQVFQVGFWCIKKQIWSTYWVDWKDNLKSENNLKNEDDLKNKDSLKSKYDLKNEDDLKIEDDLKNEDGLKNEKWRRPQKQRQLDTLSGGIPHDRYNMRGIAHARTNRKDKIFMHGSMWLAEAYSCLQVCV